MVPSADTIRRDLWPRLSPIRVGGVAAFVRQWTLAEWWMLWQLRKSVPSVTRWTARVAQLSLCDEHGRLLHPGPGSRVLFSPGVAEQVAEEARGLNWFPGEPAKPVPAVGADDTPPGLLRVDASGVVLFLRALTRRDLRLYHARRPGAGKPPGTVPALAFAFVRAACDAAGGRLFSEPEQVMGLAGGPVVSAGRLAVRMAVAAARS